MKARIVREETLDGTGCFKVYWNNEIIKAFSYTPGNSNPESIWSEGVNKQRAIEIANLLKQNNGVFVTAEEVVM